MAFEKYTTPPLKKYTTILLVLGILGLLTMCVMLGIALYQIANGVDSILIYLVPTLMGPISIFPLLFSVRFGREIKKREKDNS